MDGLEVVGPVGSGWVMVAKAGEGTLMAGLGVDEAVEERRSALGGEVEGSQIT